MREMGDFIARWQRSGGAERSNFQPFIMEMCQALDLPAPQPATGRTDESDYIFERSVRFRHDDGTESIGRIDLYRRGAFVMEGKQSRKREDGNRNRELFALGEAVEQASVRRGRGIREGRGWDAVMAGAKQQAESYARALPKEDGWPPFILVVDVGKVIEVYADFSLQGKHYAQFPDRRGYRIPLEELTNEQTRAQLRAIWLDPLSLDPAKRTAEVTREIAALLATLSQSLEKRKHNPGRVAAFLMRCLFTMFAEDVGLLRERVFEQLLERHRADPQQLRPALTHLWKEMDQGGFSPTLGDSILRFNGGLFRDTEALPLNGDEVGWLILAARRNWTNVEPAIFGTLLERALGEQERHRLGAHYTPRAYVERLVLPAIIEPLTEDWRAVQAEAADLLSRGEKAKALEVVSAFHRKLCNMRVLDPACGTGNFLYVAMELMKRLEGEVLELLTDLGWQESLELDRHTVDPHQFLGLEINPRAVAIAELVLWIGYLQWHFRTRGQIMPAEPVLKAFTNIRQQDAVLEYEKQELLKDGKGRPLTRWDGLTKKLHPITGEEIPDPAAQVPLYKYVNPRPAKWPDADFVVGNPPFIGTKRMRQFLGDGYTEALRKAYPRVPRSADLVMYWWEIAAELLSRNSLRRFGFITTNSITQGFNRRVVAAYIGSKKHLLSLKFAVPDHPWWDAQDSAAVRIAMSVVEKGFSDGVLQTVLSETGAQDGTSILTLGSRRGHIEADFRIGVSLHGIVSLRANMGVTGFGSAMHGGGFILDPARAARLRKSGADVIRPYLGGRDLLQRPRTQFVIDFSGLTKDEAQLANPEAFQHVIDHVLPEREHNSRKSIRELWWRFGWERPLLRRALSGLTRYIATTETAANRVFQFVDAAYVPDHMIIVVASDDAFLLGVLSSKWHRTWCNSAGGTLVRVPRYNSKAAFDPFPFPAASACQKQHICALGERLDAFRKERLAAHKALTMTKLYNVLEKLRRGKTLDENDKAIHELGLVSVLKQIHDELDAAVAEAYGWPTDLTDEQVLEQVVALNRARAAEERKGLVRWLRPEFQAPKEATRRPQQVEAELVAVEEVSGKPKFPLAAPDQVATVRALLAAEGKPIKAGELARKFRQGRRVEPRVRDLLQIMAAIGQAQTENGSRYFAAR